jgi:exodeoxyribonuclease V beta subunit
MIQTLNLSEFPLDSLALIEASAGTGKTYALANLYLRYLLERELSVEQILVVTFTEAATQELKDRIRLRIQELRYAFEAGGSSDPVLSYLVQRSVSVEKEQLMLRLAERQIDQARIHTIHGFCQQILKRHALDAKLPLQQNLLEDQTQLRKLAVEDFWRRYVLALEPSALKFVVARWPEPGDLLNALVALLNRPPEQTLPAATAGMLADWYSAYESRYLWYQALRDCTREMIDQVEALLIEKPLKRNNDKLKWLRQMRAWSEPVEPDFELPKTGKDSLFSRFTQSRVISETPAGKAAPEHAFFRFLETHLQCDLPDLGALFLAQSLPLVNQLIAHAKQQQKAFSFDDLINYVADAIRQGGESVSSAISAPYGVALIDEFQDTDPQQYYIFNTLFGAASSKAQPRLVLIGDPKQAIYGFRGGDIQTYLQAKRTISTHPNGRVFTMTTNWRSSPQMVEAVNAVFGLAANAFMAEDIPFQPVQAANKPLAGLFGPSLVISQAECAESASKAELDRWLAQHCVQQIRALLEQSTQLKLEQDRPLQHSDIAILVRSGREGMLMKQSLAGAGLIATVDSQSSVYHSEEARALGVLLAAVADPKDELAMRRCLAEPFFGFADSQIKAFNDQASVFAVTLQHFEYLHHKWQQAGVLAMVREALKCLGVFDYWHQRHLSAEAHQCDSSSDDVLISRHWERSLTNWNQLAEILQKQSRIQKGHFALLRWYQDTLAAVLSGNASVGDESKLRLESDAQLIRIVTIHKSKGLEYPFVFIPFLYACRPASEAWFYNAKGKLTLDLTKSDISLLAAEQERLAEDIRLLYVALTRAKYQCFIGTAAYKGQKGTGLRHTAFARLLFNGHVPERVDDEQLGMQLQHLQAFRPELIGITSVNAALKSGFLENSSDLGLAFNNTIHLRQTVPEKMGSALKARCLSRPVYDDWRVQSFTGLMHESELLTRASASVGMMPVMSREPLSGKSRTVPLSIFQFPKGSQAGTFLHTLFEELDFESAELLSASRSTYTDLKGYIEHRLKLARLVEERCIRDWADYLTEWVRLVLQVPLHDDIRLGDLNTSRYFAEMQFYFSVQQMQSQRFNVILSDYLKTTDKLEFSSFEGHLKGAIDLVFEAQGRFYILDYKSNFLGDSLEDYQPAALQQAMQEHRYDVQYLLYTLALHRFLQQRLKDRYDYERDFGGVIYLFLRGLNLQSDKSTNARSGIYYVRPPAALITKLDQELSRGCC